MAAFPKLMLDRASGIAFIPIAIEGNTAIAGDGNQYETSDCEPITLETFDTKRVLIGDEGSEIMIQRCSQGLRVNGRLRVKLLDEVDIAAQSIAQFFNGVVVSDVPERFAIQEADYDDW
jgi:hypothetical protein